MGLYNITEILKLHCHHISYCGRSYFKRVDCSAAYRDAQLDALMTVGPDAGDG